MIWNKVMMTPQDILAKNHPDKHKSRLLCLNSDGTPKKPQEAQRLVCCFPGGLQQYNTVVDPGEGPKGPGPALIFRPKWGLKGRKNIFFGDQAPPLSQSLDESETERRLCSSKRKQVILILCGNITSLLSKISHFVWTGKVHFQLKEHYFQKAGFLNSLKCSQFSFNSGHLMEMIL